ncbi:hypothetical protein DAPPUDRAFT_341198, partial [Daphnia pulex]
MEKACGNEACSNTFFSSNNRKKYCSAACYPSVIATAAAKRLGRGQKSVVPAPAVSQPAASPTYTESPPSSPAARSLDTSWAPSPSGRPSRPATAPDRAATKAPSLVRCRNTACCNYFTRSSGSRQYCSPSCRPSSTARSLSAAPSISPARPFTPTACPSPPAPVLILPVSSSAQPDPVNLGVAYLPVTPPPVNFFDEDVASPSISLATDTAADSSNMPAATQPTLT